MNENGEYGDFENKTLGVIQNFFEMAAMPFPRKGILVVLGNLPRIFPVSSFSSKGFLLFINDQNNIQ